MQIPNFKLPKTKLCTVVYHNGQNNAEVLIETPAKLSGLQMAMLGQKVGVSQIRAIKAVNADDIASAMRR